MTLGLRIFADGVILEGVLALDPEGLGRGFHRVWGKGATGGEEESFDEVDFEDLVESVHPIVASASGGSFVVAVQYDNDKDAKKEYDHDEAKDNGDPLGKVVECKVFVLDDAIDKHRVDLEERAFEDAEGEFGR